MCRFNLRAIGRVLILLSVVTFGESAFAQNGGHGFKEFDGPFGNKSPVGLGCLSEAAKKQIERLFPLERDISHREDVSLILRVMIEDGASPTLAFDLLRQYVERNAKSEAAGTTDYIVALALDPRLGSTQARRNQILEHLTRAALNQPKEALKRAPLPKTLEDVAKVAPGIDHMHRWTAEPHPKKAENIDRAFARRVLDVLKATPETQTAMLKELVKYAKSVGPAPTPPLPLSLASIWMDRFDVPEKLAESARKFIADQEAEEATQALAALLKKRLEGQVTPNFTGKEGKEFLANLVQLQGLTPSAKNETEVQQKIAAIDGFARRNHFAFALPAILFPPQTLSTSPTCTFVGNHRNNLEKQYILATAKANVAALTKKTDLGVALDEKQAADTKLHRIAGTLGLGDLSKEELSAAAFEWLQAMPPGTRGDVAVAMLKAIPGNTISPARATEISQLLLHAQPSGPGPKLSDIPAVDRGRLAALLEDLKRKRVTPGNLHKHIRDIYFVGNQIKANNPSFDLTALRPLIMTAASDGYAGDTRTLTTIQQETAIHELPFLLAPAIDRIHSELTNLRKRNDVTPEWTKLAAATVGKALAADGQRVEQILRHLVDRDFFSPEQAPVIRALIDELPLRALGSPRKNVKAFIATAEQLISKFAPPSDMLKKVIGGQASGMTKEARDALGVVAGVHEMPGSKLILGANEGDALVRAAIRSRLEGAMRNHGTLAKLTENPTDYAKFVARMNAVVSTEDDAAFKDAGTHLFDLARSKGVDTAHLAAFLADPANRLGLSRERLEFVATNLIATPTPTPTETPTPTNTPTITPTPAGPPPPQGVHDSVVKLLNPDRCARCHKDGGKAKFEGANDEQRLWNMKQRMLALVNKTGDPGVVREMFDRIYKATGDKTDKKQQDAEYKQFTNFLLTFKEPAGSHKDTNPPLPPTPPAPEKKKGTSLTVLHSVMGKCITCHDDGKSKKRFGTSGGTLTEALESMRKRLIASDNLKEMIERAKLPAAEAIALDKFVKDGSIHFDGPNVMPENKKLPTPPEPEVKHEGNPQLVILAVDKSFNVTSRLESPGNKALPPNRLITRTPFPKDKLEAEAASRKFGWPVPKQYFYLTGADGKTLTLCRGLAPNGEAGELTTTFVTTQVGSSGNARFRYARQSNGDVRWVYVRPTAGNIDFPGGMSRAPFPEPLPGTQVIYYPRIPEIYAN